MCACNLRMIESRSLSPFLLQLHNLYITKGGLLLTLQSGTFKEQEAAAACIWHTAAGTVGSNPSCFHDFFARVTTHMLPVRYVWRRITMFSSRKLRASRHARCKLLLVEKALS